MAYKTEIKKVMEKLNIPVSSKTLEEYFKYDPNDPEKKYYSRKVLSMNLSLMKSKGILKISHKEKRYVFYVLTTPQPQVQKEIKNKPKLPKLDSGEPIPEKYIPIFTVQPINDDVCTTIQNIRYKILEDGFLTPEQEKYVNQILAKIVQEEQEA